MTIYHWCAENHDWDPRVADELSLDEEYWLPVMKEASQAAAVKIAKISEAVGKGALRY